MLSTITDLIFGANLDFYDLGKPQHEGLGDILSYGFISPLIVVIYLNYYKHEKNGGVSSYLLAYPCWLIGVW